MLTSENSDNKNLLKINTDEDLKMLYESHRTFDEYTIEGMKMCITFPFAKGEHVCYEKIYAHTMKWVTNPSQGRLVYMDGTGNFYDYRN